jgi:hypothetical protein
MDGVGYTAEKLTIQEEALMLKPGFDSKIPEETRKVAKAAFPLGRLPKQLFRMGIYT